MEGLTNLLSALSDILTPAFEFIIWIFPIKIYRLNDGEKGVITTFGCVREWRKSECSKGTHFCFAFEEITVVQVIGGYIDLDEQVLTTKDNKMWVVNGAIEYSIHNVKQAILETEDIESLTKGICMNEIREYAKKKESEELLDSNRLTKGLNTKVNHEVEPHGAKVDKIMITDLRPHEVTMICDTIIKVFKDER